MQPNGKLHYGPRIDTGDIPDLFAPQTVKKFTLPEAGIDNLSLSATDTFVLADGREFTVDFDGYFSVARTEPTTDDWETGSVHVNMVGMFLEGESDELGPMSVRLNPDVTSVGQTFPPKEPKKKPQACRIATAAVFHAPRINVSLHNVEPILLMNDAIDSIPPVEDPNGHAHIYRLPLYPYASNGGGNSSNDQPLAYLMSLRYTVGDYITEEEARKLRERASI